MTTENLNEWKIIDVDGQPTVNGRYLVLYGFEDADEAYPSTHVFEDGVWYLDQYGSRESAFGNADTAGERYKFVKGL